MRCPYCGNYVMKDGHYNGVQRYECPRCHRKSMDREYPRVTCIRCGSKKVIRQGYLKTGERKYLCNNCGKYFSDKTNRIKPICECGSHNTIKDGFDRNGNQLYYCNRCGKRFVRKHEPKKNIYDKVCPKCRQIGMLKDGTSGNNKIYWKCNHCGYRYLEGGKIRLENMVDLITFIMMLGNTEKRTAELLNISAQTVKRYRQYYKNMIK